MDLPLRQAVRALVVDEKNRLLLVSFGLPDGPLWAAPGGGIEPGESHEEAICRELSEEVGLLNPAIGAAIWTRTHRVAVSPEFSGQRETFYLVAVRAFEVAPEFSAAELLAEGLTGSRWWTAAELTNDRAQRFAPTRLPELFVGLLADGPPAEPFDVGE